MKTAEKSLLRILHLEDSDLDAELLTRELRRGGLEFITRRVQTKPEFEKALAEFEPNIILADYKLPTFDGRKALDVVAERSPNVPVIIVSGTVGEETAIELLRNGATDLVLKEHLRDRLVPAVQRVMNEVWNKRARVQAEEEREQLNTELRHLASHDDLTGATGRPLFIEQLQRAISGIDASKPGAALFYIDINHFKDINNHYGVPVGDQVLIETARRLDQLISTEDLLGNFGGDKFFLLVSHFDTPADSERVLNGIKTCFTTPFLLRNFSIRLHASTGGVILKNRNATASQVLLQAEEAMKQVKSQSLQGICMVDDTMIRELQRRNDLDQNMNEAIEQGRMFLAFQPIIDLESGTVVGAEGLLRCYQKNGSIMPASDFIESLVRTKRMTSVDEWIFSYFIQNDLRVARPLLESKGFRFSFNVSPGILATIGYADLILQQLITAMIPPSAVSLEILETDLLATNGEVIENLTLLRKAGVRIAVDDFGTGYSNLMRLALLPIDAVKIDRSYLEGIVTGDEKRNALLNSLVTIAKNLGYTVTAEGVELQSQAEFLKSLGCNLMQGYLFAKPMLPEELVHFVKEWEGSTPQSVTKISPTGTPQASLPVTSVTS